MLFSQRTALVGAHHIFLGQLCTNAAIALNTAFADALAIVNPLTSMSDNIVPTVSLVNVLSGLTVGLAFLGVSVVFGYYDRR